jgi:hypothetical protein
MGRFILLLGLVLGVAHAQTSAGRITGVITDVSGAVIPRATVTAQNSETGIVTPTASNAEGLYVLYPLAPGTYTISVEAAGFRTEKIEGVVVDLEAVLSRDVHMEVMAAQRETIIVTASSPIVSDSPSVQSTMVTEQIQTLPLNARDFNQLVILSAGAVESAYSGYDFGSVAVNGNRAYGNDYMIDGTPNTNPFVRTSSTAISVDTIREFKVTSGVAAAEYGQSGTQVSIVTRSGSNGLHGSAFEYHRGTLWQATNPFDPGAVLPFRNDQFGGSVGGPVIRNHTFFFFNYEGGRESQGNPIVATTPLPAFWNGDFSSLLARNISVRDPLATGRTPFAGNLVPASRISPIALAFHPYWVTPNLPGLASNLVANSNLTNTSDQFTIRMDHTLPHNQNVSFRFTQVKSHGFSPSFSGNPSGTNAVTDSDNASFGWTAVISASMVNEVRLGFADLHAQTAYEANGLPTTASLGMLGFEPINSSVQPVPKITFTGNDAFTALNFGPSSSYGEASQNQGDKVSSAADTFTYVRGSHTIKTGVEYRHQVLPSLLQPGSSGLLTFTGGTAATSSGYSFADFLLGLPATTQQVPPMASITLRQNNFASYVQDDWRVLPRLTLDIGLRYELNFNPVEDKNRLAMFDPALAAIVVASNNGVLPASQYSPVIVQDLTNANGTWKFPLVSDKQAGYPARSLLDTQYGNWGPRFGFAYHLSNGGHQFVLRGGYGIFYNTYPIQNLEQVIAINPPFAGTFTFTQAITNGVPSITLQNPFAGNAGASISPGALLRNWDLPSNQQWNLALERDFGWGTTLSVGYIGNKGTHLFRAENLNEVYFDPVTGKSDYTYQSTFGTAAISQRTTDATSIYNAMQTIVRRRLSHGLLFEFNWTWAKGIDDVGTALNVSALDVQNLGRDRADSDYVRRHTIHLNFTWEVPVGRGQALLANAPRWVDMAAGGWRLSGIWTRYSGMRFTPTINNTGLANTRPEYIYGVQANLPADQRTVQRWFNPAAFEAPPATCGPTGTDACFGDAGRNILIGPGIDNVDASLSKSFAIRSERRRLTIRLEMFNAFNHPNYALPDANISDVNTVGSITSLVKSMREAQFAARFDF